MRYASRKFLLAAGTVISATALVWFGHISDGVYSAVVIAVVNGYFVVNGYQKKVEKQDES